jgi:hypothetical protein
VPGPSSRALTLPGFLAKWRYLAAEEPRAALEQLLYLGYGPPTGLQAQEPFSRAQRRRPDRKADSSSRWALHRAGAGPSTAPQRPRRRAQHTRR